MFLFKINADFDFTLQSGGLGRSTMFRSARPSLSTGRSLGAAGGVRQRRIVGGMSGHEGPLTDQPVSGGLS